MTGREAASDQALPVSAAATYKPKADTSRTRGVNTLTPSWAVSQIDTGERIIRGD